jgi:hypothetical protein
MSLTRLSRGEMLDGYFDYRPGQHLALIEPTGGGKTRLKYQLLRAAMAQNPGLGVRVTIPKRRDPEAAAWNAELGLKETPEWPPPRKRPWEPEPAGYAVWPKHIMGSPDEDPDEVLARNRAHIEHVMKASAQDSYQGGNVIHDADDIYVQAVIHHMNEFFSEMLTNGRSIGCGLWGANQKPSGTREGSVTSFFYNAPSHLFLGADLDERNRERFGEIGGVDRRFVSDTVRDLPVHVIDGNPISDKLYICKAAAGEYGPAMAIIGP